MNYLEQYILNEAGSRRPLSRAEWVAKIRAKAAAEAARAKSPGARAKATRRISKAKGGKFSSGRFANRSGMSNVGFKLGRGAGHVYKAATGTIGQVASAAFLINHFGNVGNTEHLKGTAIGSPKYFKVFGWTPQYRWLSEEIGKWQAKKGNSASRWDEIKTIDAAVNMIKRQDFWKRVHVRHNEIHKKASGEDDGTLDMIARFYKNLSAGEWSAAMSGEPALSDAEKEMTKKLAKKATSVKIGKRQIRAIGDVIQDEMEEFAEELDEGIDALDKWDGMATGNDAETFQEHFLPAVSRMYAQWISDNIKALKKKIENATKEETEKEEDKGEKKKKEVKTKIRMSKTAKQNKLLAGTGMSLKQLQTKLLDRGFWDVPPSEKKSTLTFKTGRADGKYGQETELAIKNLQTELDFTGRDVDGWYGPMTHKISKENPEAKGANFPGKEKDDPWLAPVSIKNVAVKLDKNTNEYIGIAALSTGKEIRARVERSGEDDSGEQQMAIAMATDRAEGYIDTLKEAKEVIMEEIDKLLKETRKV
jgi:peptidoglycan hydrolase-like protein with peptidoglycan-binding domain